MIETGRKGNTRRVNTAKIKRVSEVIQEMIGSQRSIDTRKEVVEIIQMSPCQIGPAILPTHQGHQVKVGRIKRETKRMRERKVKINS